MSWLSLSDLTEVIPLDDWKLHKEGKECWCHPVLDDDVLVHRSMDCREFYEDGNALSP